MGLKAPPRVRIPVSPPVSLVSQGNLAKVFLEPSQGFLVRALVAQWIERLPAEEKVARSNRVEGARLAASKWCAPVPQWDRGAVYETEG